MEPRYKERLTGLLTSAPLVISLLLLVVNDWYLKSAYGNWITGKLSDFTGIFLLALLVFASFPRLRSPFAIAICLAFAWWKSPLSQSAIDAINSTGLPRIGRVVDYTDLMALVMVPAAWHTLTRRERRLRAPHLLRRVLAPPMAVACLAAMVATTPATDDDVFEIREVSRPMTLDPAKAAAVMRKIFEDLGMECHDCGTPEVKGGFNGGSTFLTYVFLEDARIRFHVNYQPNQGRGFAGGYPGTSVRDIRDALKISLDEIMGKIYVRYIPERYDYKPSSDAVQLKLVKEIFDGIAKGNNLASESLGVYYKTNSRGTRDSVRFWLRDEVTLEYTVHAMGLQNVPGEIRDALNRSFSGLQFYQFERSIFFVDFQKASVIQASE